MRLTCVAILSFASALAFGQVIYDSIPEVQYREDGIQSVSTSNWVGSTISGQNLKLQVTAGSYYNGGRRSGYFTWNEENSQTSNRINMIPERLNDQYFVNDVTLSVVDGKVFAYVTGSQNPDGAISGDISYPTIQVFQWTGSDFVAATKPLKLSATANRGWYTKIATDNRGAFYTAWTESDILTYRQLKYSANYPFFQFVGGPTALNPNLAPFNPGEQVRDLDVAFNMGGTVTFAALSVNSIVERRIFSWQLKHSNQVIDPPFFEHSTTAEDIDHVSVASHSRYGELWTNPKFIYPTDYLICFCSQGFGYSTVNVTGIGSGRRTGVKQINILNNEASGISSVASIAGGISGYQAAWAYVDTQGIFGGSEGSSEVLGQQLDGNGNLGRKGIAPHKIFNSNLWRAQGFPSVSIAPGPEGNSSVGIAFMNDLTEPIDTFPIPERYIAFKLTTAN